jgi:hypothetical protein
MKIFNLPIELVSFLQDFLFSRSIFGSERIENSLSSWINLLNTNKNDFSSFKSQLIYYELNTYYSFYYIKGKKDLKEFVSRIHRKVINPSKQIGLRLSFDMASFLGEDYSIILQEMLDNEIQIRAYSITIVEMSNYSSSIGSFMKLFSSCERVVIMNCPQSCRPFKSLFLNTTKLNISHSDNFLIREYVEDLCIAKRKTEKPLLQELDFSYSKVSCLSFLSSLHKVSLANCSFVWDVTPLKNIRYVNISGCSLVEDVSMLCNVYSLDISHCQKIKDISALVNVVILNICSWYIDNEVGLAPINAVRRLTMTFDGFDGIVRDDSWLSAMKGKELKHITYYEFSQTHHFQNLQNFYSITLASTCLSISDLKQHFFALRSLTLEDVDLRPVSSSTEVSDTSQEGVFGNLPFLQRLNAHKVEGLKQIDLIILPSLVTMILSDCEPLKTLAVSHEKLKNLYIRGGHMEKLTIPYSLNVLEIKDTGNLSCLFIDYSVKPRRCVIRNSNCVIE